MSSNRRLLITTSILSLLVMGTHAGAFGQGRGHGGGVGPPGGGGPPPGVGVDRGLGRSSDASAGRADSGRANASDKSNGRSDAGLERARMASANLRNADNDLRRHPGIPASLHVTANDLRRQYQAALAGNPNLEFGQFVAATRLANNLGRRNPAITRDAILSGLAAGHSIGQTLHRLGLGNAEAKQAIKVADRESKHSKQRK
jgi:hypothetical protein